MEEEKICPQCGAVYMSSMCPECGYMDKDTDTGLNNDTLDGIED